MTNHATCRHDATKAARAACRRSGVSIVIHREENVYELPGHRVMIIRQDVDGGRYVVVCSCGTYSRTTRDLSLCAPYAFDHLRPLQ